MSRKISPSRKIGGTIRVPGDKSIAHRVALLSIIAGGPIEIQNFPDNADCRSSLAAAESLGVTIERSDERLRLIPPKNNSWPDKVLIDCGNSGTTARLLAGIVAGSKCSVILTGDDSLSARPMKRIVDPLNAMGAELADTEGHLPLTVCGKALLPFEYRMPIASAQVKSALLLAGVASGCAVTVTEETITRNHTEIMLKEMGAPIEIQEIKPVLTEDPTDPRKRRMLMPEDYKARISLESHAKLSGGSISIPGDFSSAAYFFTAAAISRGKVTVEDVGLNRTRTGFLDYLRSVGCTVEIKDRRVQSGEAVGTVTVTGGALKSRRITGETTVQLIDEIPCVAVVAAFANGTTIIRDASELRLKESDRLAAIAENLTRMGVKVGLLEDGLAIESNGELQGADLLSFGDHRIAMAFSIAALVANGPSTIDDPSAVDITFPEFYSCLKMIAS